MDDSSSEDIVSTISVGEDESVRHSSGEEEDVLDLVEEDQDVVEVLALSDSASDVTVESPVNEEPEEVVADDFGSDVVLVDESDFEGEDERGEEEEEDAAVVLEEIEEAPQAAAATPESNPSQPNSQSSSFQPSRPATVGSLAQPGQQRHHTVSDQVHGVASTSAEPGTSDLVSSSSNDTDVSGRGVSAPQSEHEPSRSSLLGQNTSQNEWPLFRRPGLSMSLTAASSANLSESITEFRSPKRRRIMSPIKTDNSKQHKNDHAPEEEEDDDDDDDDGNCCSICFEPWDNSGKHRLASLKCGHLFGLGCIEKWLKGQGGKCPSCNEKAKMKDIRVIYAKAIKMIDTTERDRALQELEKEKELRRGAELDAAQARLQCQQYVEQSRKLSEQVERLQGELSVVRSHTGGGLPLSQASRAQPSHSKLLQGQFVHDKTIKIWDGGQCRVLAHCPSMAVLVISQPSANNLFPGFGIKKLSCMDFKTTSYLTLHQKAVRGVSFHQNVDDAMLLSVSMDKTVKLTNIITNHVVQTYKADAPLWSCEWNADDPNYFYVGHQNGVVLEFDTRRTAEHVRELNTDGSKSPVVALQYLSRNVNTAFKPGGLIVGQLDKVSFFETKGDNETRLHILPLEGNLTSLTVDARTRHLLASFRPTAKHPCVRHQLCELTSHDTVGNNMVSCNGVQTFHGGRSQSVLSKTMLVSHPEDQSRLLVVAGDEPSEAAHLWDSGTSQLMQRLPCQGVPVDFSSFTHNNTTFLAALTDKRLKLHRWN